MLAYDQDAIRLTSRERALLQSLTGHVVDFTSRRELDAFVQSSLKRIKPDQPGACLASCLLENFLQE